MTGKALRYLLPLAIFVAIAFFLWRASRSIRVSCPRH